MPERRFIPKHDKKGAGLIFLSHVDYVHKKMRWKVQDDRISGVLDDMLPSAILASCLGQIQSQVVFTEDEETGMKHAQRIARRIMRDYPPPAKMHRWMSDRSWLPVVCVLEVTAAVDGVDVMFENFVYFDTLRIRKAMAKLRDVRFVINGAGSWDETWRMAEAKLPAFSLCLPVVGDYHTYGATAALASIDKFRRTLLALDHALT
jgi:hypothetical protein